METLFNHILKATNTAVVYFNDQLKLVYYNKQTATIWKLPNNFLERGLNIIEFFEVLREKQVYPLNDDFEVFRKNLINYFNNKQPIINNLILSDGQNYEENIIPYNNGLIFIWENTTKLWETIYSLNNYKNLYHRIVNNLPLPIIIVGSNGLIEGYNNLFCNFFKINSENLKNDIHISNLLKLLEPLYQKNEITKYLSGLLLSRKEFTYNLKLLNGYVIDINGFPLPNGNNFIIFRNTENISPKINFSEIKSNLHDLQTSLILELEQLINTPINIITGFADMLKEGYLGMLNTKQTNYINKIIYQAENIKNQLNNKAELTLYNDNQKISMTNVDINEVIVSSMHQIKNKLSEKKLKINLSLPNEDIIVLSNDKYLTKLITLILLYLIEQNQINSTIEIVLSNNPLTIILKDTSTFPLFSPLELNSRFDLILILKNLELLKGNYKVLVHNRSFRTLVLTFNT